MGNESYIHRESAARVRACLNTLLAKAEWHFFGNLALHLPILEDSSRKTLASNGKNIMYNPYWVADNTSDTIKAALARVVLACALKHHTRRGERDYETWQKASYEATLPMMRDAGLVTTPAYEEHTVEEWYQMLYGGSESGGSGDGDSQGDSVGEGAGSGSEGGDGSGDDGSGGGSPSTDPKGSGEVMDRPSSGSDDKEDGMTEQEWDAAVHQAMQTARSYGSGGGSLSELAHALASVYDGHREARLYVDAPESTA